MIRIDFKSIINSEINGLKVIDFRKEIKNSYKRTILTCMCKCEKILEIEYYSLLRRKTTTCSQCEGCGEITSAIYAKIKKGADSRNLEFNISKSDLWNLFISQGRLCAITKKEITLQSGRKVGTASLDRIDSNIGYTIENCQWVHKIVNISKHRLSDEEFISMCYDVVKNNNNTNQDWTTKNITNYKQIYEDRIDEIPNRKKTSKEVNAMTLTFDGKTKTIREWGIELSINSTTIYNRFIKGWTVEKILTTKVSEKDSRESSIRRKITHNGETKSVKEWAIANDIRPITLLRRLSNGVPMERAINKTKLVNNEGVNFYPTK